MANPHHTDDDITDPAIPRRVSWWQQCGYDVHRILTGLFRVRDFPFLIPFGLTLLACHAFFWTTTEDNTAAYVGYNNVASRIRTSMRLGVSDEPGFIREIDAQLAGLNNIHIHFDATQVDLGRTRLFELSEPPGGSDGG